MPIQAWYDSSLDIGQPAFVQFWGNFLNSRSAVNQQVMKERLAASDPARLRLAQQDLLDAVTDLQRKKADIVRTMVEQGGKAAQGASKERLELMKTLRSVYETGARESGASSRENARNETNLTASLMREQQIRREKIDKDLSEKGVTKSVEAAGSAAKRKSGDALEQAKVYDSRLQELNSDFRQGSDQEATLIADVIREAENRGHAEAAEVLRRKYGVPKGEDVYSWVDRRQGLYSGEESAAIAREVIREAQGGASPDKMVQILNRYGFDIGSEGLGTYETETSEKTRTGTVSEVGGAPASFADQQLRDALQGLDKQIEDYNKELKALQAQRATIGSDSFFSGFMGNALLETQFMVPPTDVRPHVEALKTLAPHQQKLIGDLLEEAGGDPGKAVELLKSRRAEAGVEAIEPLSQAETGTIQMERIEPDEATIDAAVQPIAQDQAGTIQMERIPASANATLVSSMGRQQRKGSESVTRAPVASSAFRSERQQPSFGFIPPGESAESVARQLLEDLKATRARMAGYVTAITNDKVKAADPENQKIVAQLTGRIGELDQIMDQVTEPPIQVGM